MKMNKSLSGSTRALISMLTLSLALVLTGCSIHSKSASTEGSLLEYLNKKQDAAAFGSDKIFGIVSITAVSKIHEVGADGTFTGLFSAMSEDRGFLENSQQILDKSIPYVVGSMSRTSKYLLLPQQNILADQAYAGVTSESNSAFNHNNVARGYKRITSKQHLASLARELGLDGAMHVQISYGFSNEGTNIGGLVNYGRNFASVKVNVTAVDDRGKVIWKASEASLSKQPVTSDNQIGSAANFRMLEPHLMQSLQTTLTKVMQDLESG